MDNRYLGLTEMYREASMNNIGNKPMYNTKIGMNSCVNDDYCMTKPQKTNGILTMAFVNMQPLESVYSPETALCNGTLFPNINKPFMGGMVR